MKANTMTSIEVNLKEEAIKRGLNFSYILEEALKKELEGTSYLSPLEKQKLDNFEKEKAEKEAKIKKRYEYLENQKEIVRKMDQVNWSDRQRFLDSEKPSNYKEDENAQLWLETVEVFRQSGIRIGIKQLELYWKWKKYGDLGIEMEAVK